MNTLTRRSLRRDDGAVTEVIGYVLSFALSAIFLLVALNLFYTAKGNTEDVVAAVELRSIADRVATRVVEAGLASQEFPAASFEYTINIPQSLNGRPYYLEIDPDTFAIDGATHDGLLSASSTTFKLDTIVGLVVDGRVESSNERVVIRYTAVGGSPTITIQGD